MSTQSEIVHIICDCRQLNIDANDVGSINQLWQRVSHKLVNKSLSYTRPIYMKLPEGRLILWSANVKTNLVVSKSTQFEIIDLIRKPTLLYHCKVCDEYGPLRCKACEKAKKEQTRLCSKHAHTIQDELSAYCSDHIPKCHCSSNCTQNANFRCHRCHKLFGNHYLKHHPNNKDVDYCQSCHDFLFEKCEISDCNQLGKLKCAYITREMKTQCKSPLCAEHSYQWKILGPHNRGVALCTKHKNMLVETEATDLLLMMLIVHSSYIHRGKQRRLPNPFTLRKIINRNLKKKLTFDELGLEITSLENKVSSFGNKVKRNYYSMSKQYKNISVIEEKLFSKVKEFYQSIIGHHANQKIEKVKIIKCYYKDGKLEYKVKIYLNTTDKGHFIGKGGVHINKLRNEINKLYNNLRLNVNF